MNALTRLLNVHLFHMIANYVSKIAGIMPNSADPDKTAAFKQQSDLDLLCLFKYFGPNIYHYYNMSLQGE